MQAPLQARNDSDAAQADAARAVARQRVLTDDRPEAVAQRKLVEMVNDSPRVLQKHALSDAIHNSPPMAAQRHDLNALFGGAVKSKGDGAMPAEASPAQHEEKPNTTGLPNQLKSGIECLSGMSMDHVKVHYNSDKPAQLQALAYAQGTEIHLAAGQERHLPHEAWHVVQQAQGRVRPTLQMKAGAVNDDPSLEKEADIMGGKAAQFQRMTEAGADTPLRGGAGAVVQRVLSPESQQQLAQHNYAGALPNEAQLAVMAAFFDSIDDITWAVANYGLASYAQISQLCQLRFTIAELRTLRQNFAGPLTLAHVQFLANLARAPSMHDIIALAAQQVGGQAIGGDNLGAAAATIYTFAEIRQLAQLPVIGQWGDIINLSAAGVPFADIQLFAPLQIGGANCTPATMITCHGYRFTAQEIVQLAALPVVTQWAHLATLHGGAAPAAHILGYGGIAINGSRLTPDTLAQCQQIRFTAAEAQVVANLPQVTGWPDFARLHALTWAAADLAYLSPLQLGGRTPTLDEMCRLAAFTRAEAQHLYGNNAAPRDWTALAHHGVVHAAPVGDPSEDVITSMAALRWREEKRDQHGVLDRNRSCWNWATKGFEATNIPDQAIFMYFARRTNYPPYYGGRLNHAGAVDYVAGVGAGPVRAYLDQHQAALQAIVDQFIQGQQQAPGNANNQQAQLALMRHHLATAGFQVLPQGTASRWYICMHEVQTNVGWEHWWIKSRVGDVIETFPETVDANGVRGRYIAFHQYQVNMGDLATDFRHEVPVQNLLPAQLAIIRRALQNLKAHTNTLLH